MHDEENNITILKPKPYEEVGIRFIIEGLAPKSWLDTGFGMSNSISLEFINIDGQTFIGTSVYIIADKNDQLESKNRLRFYGVFQFNQFNASFIIESRGRITLKLSGYKEGYQLFIPIIVKIPNYKFKPGRKIINKHGKIGEMILQYERDLKDYNEKIENIRISRQRKNDLAEDDDSNYRYGRNWEVMGSILNILDRSTKGSKKDYPFIEEDLAEKKLKRKYKDAIKWRGPLLHGLVGKMDGFEFRVYSNDHDKHFHVIHKQKRINARFSFPEIKLVNYKNIRNSIRAKDCDKIIAFFKVPENFKKLEEEFQRRP